MMADLRPMFRRRSRDRAKRQFLQGREFDGFINPLDRFTEVDEWKWCNGGRAYRPSIDNNRAGVWDELPNVFGFESWDAIAANEKT